MKTVSKYQISANAIYFALLFCLVSPSCQKGTPAVSEDRNANTFPLNGVINAPASLYYGIDIAPTPAGSQMLPVSFSLEIPKSPLKQGREINSCTSIACAELKTILDHYEYGMPYPSGENSILYSPSYLFNQTHQDPNDCKKLGSLFFANLDTMQKQGIALIQDFPYDPQKGSCLRGISPNEKDLASLHKISSFKIVDPLTVQKVKELIYAHIPIAVAHYTDDNFENSCRGYYVWKDFKSKKPGTHAGVIYGWDDTKGTRGALRMLNTWGPEPDKDDGRIWGENGTIWIDYDLFENGITGFFGSDIFYEAYVIYNPVLTFPIADFGVVGSAIINTGQSISFKDQSSNSPTSWAWSFNGGTPSTSKSQNPVITYNTPGTYNVTLTATNSAGSNTKTKTAYIAVNAVPWSCGQPFTDTRDGKTYGTVNIGGKCWMKDNLKYASPNSRTYGSERYYSWTDAVLYAPSGWHVPSDAEWQQLEMYLGMTAGEATSLSWRGSNQGTQVTVGGSSGLNLPYTGYEFTNSVGVISGIQFYGTQGFFWASTLDVAGANGYCRQISTSLPQIYRGTRASPGFYASVRCVKN